MLRIVVGVLLAANVVIGAYYAGWLSALGWGASPNAATHTPMGEVAPERIVIVSPTAAVAPSGPADTALSLNQEPAPADDPTPAPAPDTAAPSTQAQPTVCRALSELTPEDHTQAEQALQSVLQNTDRWSSTETLINGRWIVYIGKLTEEQLQSRRAQLRAANIDHRVVTTPRLAPGLALGTYSAPERARNALTEARSQGVRDARVEQERAPTRAFALRINDLTPDELAAIEAQDAFKGKTLQPCP